MPNQIHFPFNTWGYNDGGIDKQIRLLLWLIKDFSATLFQISPRKHRWCISSYHDIEELKKYDIKSSFALVDAGFYSEDNIKELNSGVIDFLTRLPARTKLYKDLIKEVMADIDYIQERCEIWGQNSVC